MYEYEMNKQIKTNSMESYPPPVELPSLPLPNGVPLPPPRIPSVRFVPVQSPVSLMHLVSQRLMNLALTTGYDIIQDYGQRKMGPPPGYNGANRPEGSEVFVGKLPKDMFEDELYPLFRAIGPIFEIRLMLYLSGYNRGFAFITYMNRIDASKAVEQLNNYEVRPSCRITVNKNIDNRRLYIGNIPCNKTKEEAMEELTKYFQGIVDVIMYPLLERRTDNRRFMFVEFCSHKAAARAKYRMRPETVVLWGQPVIVDWADPEPDIDPIVFSQGTRLFLRNLNWSVNHEVLRGILLHQVPASSIQKIYIQDDYAFIHFDNRRHAQLAKDMLTGFVIDGLVVEVQWAIPKRFSKKYQMNFCRSLPRCLRRHSRRTLE